MPEQITIADNENQNTQQDTLDVKNIEKQRIYYDSDFPEKPEFIVQLETEENLLYLDEDQKISNKLSKTIVPIIRIGSSIQDPVLTNIESIFVRIRILDYPEPTDFGNNANARSAGCNETQNRKVKRTIRNEHLNEYDPRFEKEIKDIVGIASRGTTIIAEYLEISRDKKALRLWYNKDTQGHCDGGNMGRNASVVVNNLKQTFEKAGKPWNENELPFHPNSSLSTEIILGTTFYQAVVISYLRNAGIVPTISDRKNLLGDFDFLKNILNDSLRPLVEFKTPDKTTTNPTRHTVYDPTRLCRMLQAVNFVLYPISGKDVPQDTQRISSSTLTHVLSCIVNFDNKRKHGFDYNNFAKDVLNDLVVLHDRIMFDSIKLLESFGNNGGVASMKLWNRCWTRIITNNRKRLEKLYSKQLAIKDSSGKPYKARFGRRTFDIEEGQKRLLKSKAMDEYVYSINKVDDDSIDVEEFENGTSIKETIIEDGIERTITKRTLNVIDLAYYSPVLGTKYGTDSPQCYTWAVLNEAIFWPIFSSFRACLMKNEEGKYVWKLGDIEDVLKFWEEKGSSILLLCQEHLKNYDNPASYSASKEEWMRIQGFVNELVNKVDADAARKETDAVRKENEELRKQLDELMKRK